MSVKAQVAPSPPTRISNDTIFRCRIYSRKVPAPLMIRDTACGLLSQVLCFSIHASTAEKLYNMQT